MTYTRPLGAYTSVSTTENATKYQDDAAAVPKRAISSAKIDGDLNFVIDALNELAAAGINSALPGQTGNADKVLTTNGTDANFNFLTSTNMAANGVSAGTYALANVTVNSKGFVTSVTAGQVGTAQIVDGAVTSDKIALGASGDTGDFKWSMRSSLTSWVLLDGKTIGDASSGATSRANADTEDLFTLLWEQLANSEAAVSSGRGASAAADFAAHKTIAVPDMRGRTPFGKDNMGGSAASRVTSGNSGITGTTLGASGGSELLHQHTHTVNDSGHTHPITRTADSMGNTGGGTRGLGTGSTDTATSSATTGITLANAGSGSSQNMPPAMMWNAFIRL